MTEEQKKKALQSPSAVFDRPADVVDCDLSHAEKIAVLKQWEVDARQLEEAATEGMAPTEGVPPAAGGERSRLSEVKKAQRQLDEIDR